MLVEYKNFKKLDKKDAVICCIDPGVKNMAILIVKMPEKTPIFFDLVEVGECPNSQLNFFESKIEIFGKVDNLFVEKQINSNLKAVRLASLIETFFMIHFKQCIIVEIPSSFKLKNTQKYEIKSSKKRCMMKAQEILDQNKETYRDIQTFLDTKKKKDDISDVICYVEEVIGKFGV